MNNVVFKTVKEIADWLRTHYETELSFTNDTLDEITLGEEPTGWYGFISTKAFEGNTILIGYYGGGVFEAECTFTTGRSFENVICDFFKSEFDREMNDDSQICIDADEWK